MANAPIGGVEVLEDAALVLEGARKLNFANPLAAAVDGGDPPRVNVALAAGGIPLEPQTAEATSLIVTALDVYDVVPDMVITPGAGTYFVMFSTSASVDKNARFGLFSVFANGVQILESEREIGGQSNNRGGVFCMAFSVTVADAQDIDIRWKVNTTTGGPVLSAVERQMILIPST